jgi:hypothetical protein
MKTTEQLIEEVLNEIMPDTSVTAHTMRLVIREAIERFISKEDHADLMG